jgi:P-type Cu+ transporter
VREIVTADGLSQSELLRLAASLDRMSAHVLGEALVTAAQEAGLELTMPDEVQEEPGQGIAGSVDGRRVLVGSRAFMQATGVAPDEIHGTAVATTRGSGEAHVVVAVDGHVAGVIVMADELRPDARDGVERLRAEGISHVAMASGDRRSVAERVGRELAMDRVYAELSPEGKLDIVRRMRDDHQLRKVVMVGDGVNDAPALAQADLGLSIGTGTDVAIEASDLTLVSGDPRAAADAIRLSRATLRTIKQNLTWAFGYNVAALPLAAIGLLNPVIASAAMAFSSVSVVANALRLRRFGA